MPGNHPAPPIALLSEVDMRALASVIVMQREDSTPVVHDVTLASTAGFYEDLLSFLNGRGSEPIRTLEFDLQTSWTGAGGAGNITVGIDNDDRVYIESDTTDFSIGPHADNATFGFDVAGAGPAGGLAPFRLTATAEWIRGNVTNKHLKVWLTDPVVAVYAPSVPYQTQDVVTLIRSANEGDADAQHSGETLEDADNDANDNVSRRIRWGIDASGKVWTAWPDNMAISTSPPTWTAAGDALREWLGANGTENSSTAIAGRVADVRVVTFSNYAAGVLCPSRPLESLTRSRKTVVNAVRLTDGDIANNTILDFGRWNLNFWLDGPADENDMHRHLLEKVVPYLSNGDRVAIYQQWGDPRRAGTLRSEVWDNSVTPPVVSREAYGLLYTVEEDGYRGRLRCRMSPNMRDTTQAAWPRALRLRAPANLLAEDVVD